MRKASQFSLFFVAALLPAQLSFADDSARLLRVDHYVRVHSTVPAIAGQTSQIYVREVVQAGIALRGPAPDRVALFVHGAGTPAEVAFDVPYPGLQLDGVPGARGLRRVLHGHDGLRALHAACADERPVQSLARAAGRLHPRAHSRALFAQLSASVDHHRVGLERSGRRDRLPAFAASCRQGEHGGMVAGRSARRRLHGAASGTSKPIGVAGSRVQSRGLRRSAGAVAGRWNHDDHASPTTSSPRIGRVKPVAPIKWIRLPAIRCGSR